MRWDRDGYSVESAQAKGRPIPDDHWSHDKPDELPGDHIFHEAFRDLQTERAPDGPIPWGRVMAYAAHHRFDRESANLLWAVIRRMDRVDRQWRIDELRREIGNGG